MTRVMYSVHICWHFLLQHKGLTYLEAGARMEKALRGPLCSMTLLGYHTVMTYVLGKNPVLLFQFQLASVKQVGPEFSTKHFSKRLPSKLHRLVPLVHKHAIYCRVPPSRGSIEFSGVRTCGGLISGHPKISDLNLMSILETRNTDISC